MGLSVGQKLGKYEILAEVGRGGMATVYKAYDPATERNVAIKVMLPEMAKDPTFARRFEREAKTVASLQHIHILPVFDYGREEDTAYLVMPFLSGRTLVDVIEEGDLSLKDVSRLFRQLAGALDYAHLRGLLHRDIKPSNVLMDESGNALLSDFGLTRMIEDSQHFTKLTATSTVVGTPAYMSPEQGQGMELSSRSDLYSLGVVLYEMLTGDVPFHAETPIAVIFKHISDPLPSLLDKNPDLPPQLDQVLHKALAKSAEDRFPVATDIADALDAAIAGLAMPTPAPESMMVDMHLSDFNGDKPKRKVRDDGELYTEDLALLDDEKPKNTPQPQTSPRRNLQWMIAGLAAVLVMGVATAIFFIADGEAGGATPVLQFTAHPGESITSLALSPNGARIITGGTDDTARVWDIGDGSEIFVLEAHSGDVLSVAYRPDSGEISTGGADNMNYTWNPENGTAGIPNLEGGPVRVAYSPQGTYDAYVTNQSLMISDAQVPGMPIHYILQNPTSSNYTSLAFSPDETRLATGDESGTVQIWDVETGEVTQRFSENRLLALDVNFSPDGTFIIASGDDGLIYVLDILEDELAYTLDAAVEGAVNAAVYSADGTRILAAYEDGAVRLWDVESQQVIQSYAGHEGAVTDVDFTPDGTRIVSGGADGEVIIWEIDRDE